MPWKLPESGKTRTLPQHLSIASTQVDRNANGMLPSRLRITLNVGDELPDTDNEGYHIFDSYGTKDVVNHTVAEIVTALQVAAGNNLIDPIRVGNLIAAMKAVDDAMTTNGKALIEALVEIGFVQLPDKQDFGRVQG